MNRRGFITFLLGIPFVSWVVPKKEKRFAWSEEYGPLDEDAFICVMRSHAQQFGFLPERVRLFVPPTTGHGIFFAVPYSQMPALADITVDVREDKSLKPNRWRIESYR